MTHIIDRRKALAVVAAVPVAAALSAPVLASVEGPSELAALVRRYLAEVEAFNNAWDLDDSEADKLAAATFERTLRKIVRTPARTAEDGVAAIDCLLKDSEHCMVALDEESVHGALIRTVRTYLAGRVRIR